MTEQIVTKGEAEKRFAASLTNINKLLKKIASGVGWSSLWLFFIMLNTCGPQLVGAVLE